MNDNRSRVWFAGFVLLVFVSGLALGVILTRVLARPAPFGFSMMGRRGGDLMMRGPELRIDRLAESLGLNDTQRKEIDRVFGLRRDRLRKFREEANSRFEAEQKEIRAQIEKILTSEQLKRFDEMGRGFGPGFGPLGRGKGRRNW